MRRWLVIATTLFLIVCAMPLQVIQAASDSISVTSVPSNTFSNGAQGDPSNSIGGSNETGTIGKSAEAARKVIESNARQQLDQLPTDQIDAYWKRIQDQYGGFLPDLSGQGLVHAMFNNGGALNFRNVLHGLTKYFFTELFDDAQLLGSILILSVIAAILESMQSAFEEKAVSQVAYMVVFFVLMMLAIHSFMETIGAAKHAIQTMNDFMLASIPLTITLLAASGALASAAFFQPMLIFVVHFISTVVYVVVFPLIFFSAVLDLTSTLSVRYQLTRLASLLRTIGLGILGFSMSVFIGVTTVQGLGKGIADGVVLRTVKFGVGTFVPVIGKAVSDAAETVLSASLLVKNAVGVAGLVILSLIVAFPALKILAVSLIYGGSAALMQPLGDTPMVACLATLSKTLLLVFACVAAVGLMFFFAICILLVTANLTVITA